MFGYPFLRPCEYKQGIVRKMIFRPASATRNSVIIVVVPRFDQIIYVIGQEECLVGKEEYLVGKEDMSCWPRTKDHRDGLRPSNKDSI